MKYNSFIRLFALATVLSLSACATLPQSEGLYLAANDTTTVMTNGTSDLPAAVTTGASVTTGAAVTTGASVTTGAMATTNIIITLAPVDNDTTLAPADNGTTLPVITFNPIDNGTTAVEPITILPGNQTDGPDVTTVVPTMQTTTQTPVPIEPTPKPQRKFDGASFGGGIALGAGLLIIAFVMYYCFFLRKRGYDNLTS